MTIFIQNEAIIIRSLISEDELEKLMTLENQVWPADLACSKENFHLRYNYFKDGFLIAVTPNGKIVGSFYGIFYDYYIGRGINWHIDSGDGTGSSHNPSANSMFGISITCSKDAPEGTMRSIVEAWKLLGKKFNKKYIYGGSRLCGFHQYQGSIEDYVRGVSSGKLFDPVLTKWLACGMRPGAIIKNYFEDPESKNYGVEIYLECDS